MFPLDPWLLAADWVPFVIGERREVVVALDWTDFDADDQTTIAAHLVEPYNRTTPLVWRTVRKSALTGQRNEHEDAVLRRLRETLPAGVKCAILADRGFADVELFEHLRHLGFEFVIRMRSVVLVESADGESRPPPNGSRRAASRSCCAMRW